MAITQPYHVHNKSGNVSEMVQDRHSVNELQLTLVQSAVLRSHVVCLSVCLSVCPSVCDGQL